MKKLSVCILFGGTGPEHESSLRSAESVLNHIDREKYNVFPVGITREGDWILFRGEDLSALSAGTWKSHPENRRAAISPVRGQGLLSFEGDCVVRERIDVVFPLLQGEYCRGGAVQGLLQMAGIPYVGADVESSAVVTDKTLTKLVLDHVGVAQADWTLLRRVELVNHMDNALEMLENRFSYPMYVRPSFTYSPAGASQAEDREGLHRALETALSHCEKVLVEEYIQGTRVDVAVMGNGSPVASICGGLDNGAQIPEEVEELVREAAVKVHSATGCKDMSCISFLVTGEENRLVFREIDNYPDFSSASQYPALFAASGIEYAELIDELLNLAMEDCQ